MRAGASGVSEASPGFDHVCGVATRRNLQGPSSLSSHLAYPRVMTAARLPSKQPIRLWTISRRSAPPTFSYPVLIAVQSVRQFPARRRIVSTTLNGSSSNIPNIAIIIVQQRTSSLPQQRSTSKYTNAITTLLRRFRCRQIGL